MQHKITTTSYGNVQRKEDKSKGLGARRNLPKDAPYGKLADMCKDFGVLVKVDGCYDELKPIYQKWLGDQKDKVPFERFLAGLVGDDLAFVAIPDAYAPKGKSEKSIMAVCASAKEKEQLKNIYATYLCMQDVYGDAIWLNSETLYVHGVDYEAV